MPTLLPGESDTNPAGSVIDRNAIIAAMLGALHSESVADLTMWSECELVQWIDAAVKKLARAAALFAGRDVDGTTAAGQRTYALPTQHLTTLHVTYDQAPLRPSSAGELAMLSSTWQTAQGPSGRWYQETLGLATLGLFPVPDQARALWIIYTGWPQSVDCAGAHTTIPLPATLEPFLELDVIAEAYSKEGDGYAPDIAQAAREMAAVYAAVALEFWGPSQ